VSWRFSAAGFRGTTKVLQKLTIGAMTLKRAGATLVHSTTSRRNVFKSQLSLRRMISLTVFFDIARAGPMSR
jgi:hypothetical protein